VHTSFQWLSPYLAAVGARARDQLRGRVRTRVEVRGGVRARGQGLLRAIIGALARDARRLRRVALGLEREVGHRRRRVVLAQHVGEGADEHRVQRDPVEQQHAPEAVERRQPRGALGEGLAQQRAEGHLALGRVARAQLRAQCGVAQLRLDAIDRRRADVLPQKGVDVGARPEELVGVVVHGALGERGGGGAVRRLDLVLQHLIDGQHKAFEEVARVVLDRLPRAALELRERDAVRKGEGTLPPCGLLPPVPRGQLQLEAG
jgi:hypothetical protein